MERVFVLLICGHGYAYMWMYVYNTPCGGMEPVLVLHEALLGLYKGTHTYTRTCAYTHISCVCSHVTIMHHMGAQSHLHRALCGGTTCNCKCM